MWGKWLQSWRRKTNTGNGSTTWKYLLAIKEKINKNKERLTCKTISFVQVVGNHFRSELCLFFFLLFLDQRLYNRFNYIITGQSSKERKRTRISFYHWLLPWTAYNVNRKNPNHHRKNEEKKYNKKKRKKPLHIWFLVNNIQDCIIQFRKKKGIF